RSGRSRQKIQRPRFDHCCTLHQKFPLIPVHSDGIWEFSYLQMRRIPLGNLPPFDCEIQPKNYICKQLLSPQQSICSYLHIAPTLLRQIALRGYTSKLWNFSTTPRCVTHYTRITKPEAKPHETQPHPQSPKSRGEALPTSFALFVFIRVHS